MSLNRNAISQIPTKYFSKFSQLHDIRLSRNNLSNFSSLLWLEESIKRIHISNNRIQSLDELPQHGYYESLLYIDASHNVIKYFNISHVINCPRPRNLYLTGNQLIFIGDYRSYVPYDTIGLYQNPFHCDSELVWMIGLTSQRITCHSPTCFVGQLVSGLSTCYLHVLNFTHHTR